MHEGLETLMAHPVWCIQQVKIPLTGQQFVLWLGLAQRPGRACSGLASCRRQNVKCLLLMNLDA